MHVNVSDKYGGCAKAAVKVPQNTQWYSYVYTRTVPYVLYVESIMGYVYPYLVYGPIWFVGIML